jgi:hypothetical protein
MSEPSLNRQPANISAAAPVNANTVSDSEGVAISIVEQPSSEIILKRVLAGGVAVAGALLTVLPEHTIAYRVCFALVGLGAALGITSRGVQPKQ